MPTNIYDIPALYWNQLDADEQAAFNYKFSGGIQIKDILYHPAMDTDISVTAEPTEAMHNPALYTPWAATTVYNPGDLVNYDHQDYICVTGHTSGSYFDPTMFSADNADLSIDDFRNIKTYFTEYMVQHPVPGIVTGIVGSEINQSVKIAKRFFDVLRLDLIKETYHTVKKHSQFNI